MKILKFNGQLLDIMGDTDARSNWQTKLGLKIHSGHQSTEEGITLMEVIDEDKAVKYLSHPDVEVLTPEEANAILAEKMDKVIYKRYDDALYGANISKKITEGSLDIEKMLPEWDEKQELEYLYNQGVSGIKKIGVKVDKFSITKE